MVDFYLMRHGDALAAIENPQRPLSVEGRRRVERTAQLALERGVRVSIVYHSGILRAVETADLMAEKLVPAAGVAQLSGLLPEDDPAIVKATLELAQDAMLLVGHLPFMGRLAGLLVHGDPEQPVVEFSPASMICCSRVSGRWKFAWQVAP